MYIDKFARETNRVRRQFIKHITKAQYPRFIALNDDPERVNAMTEEEHAEYRKLHADNMPEYYEALWEDIQKNPDSTTNLRALCFTNTGWSEFETGPPGEIEVEVWKNGTSTRTKDRT